MQKKIIIAIDGYSSCGKSTFAKAIALRLGYIFIDTGAMYRGVTLWALRHGVVHDARAIVRSLDQIDIAFVVNPVTGRSELLLNGENVDIEIRSLEVSDAVSLVSQIEAVRSKLVALQQRMGAAGGVVMDGRDIGTVVFPNAELKIFMTADPAVRAERRFLEMNGAVSLAQIEANVRERDFQDENRTLSPLRRAEDALLLDNTSMSVEQQMAWVMDRITPLIGPRAPLRLSDLT